MGERAVIAAEGVLQILASVCEIRNVRATALCGLNLEPQRRADGLVRLILPVESGS